MTTKENARSGGTGRNLTQQENNKDAQNSSTSAGASAPSDYVPTFSGDGTGWADNLSPEEIVDRVEKRQEEIFPPAHNQRPCWRILDEWKETKDCKYRPGVYYCGIKRLKEEDVPFDQWICAPLYIEAITFDGQENNFGRLLRFKTSLGKWREWAMPMELLAGRGETLRAELLAMGLEMDSYEAQRQLPAYLQYKTPERKIHCALQTGWARNSFVLPDVVIGPDATEVIFQSGERGHEEYTRSGTLEEWRQEIAAKAVGNPLLILSISAGFSGPLMKITSSEGGGCHFTGDSSIGKTGLVDAACSIWGGENYRRSWRATANGLEGAAALFNDNLLALDEISEADPREVGNIVYAIANGYGKQRARRTGSARSIVRWRCMVLSNGERTIETTMNLAGHRAKAGQSVRLLNIPVNRKYGAWDDTHGMTPAGFTDHLKRSAKKYHGEAGRAFLEKLTADNRDLCANLEMIADNVLFASEPGDGQDKRAATRFALIGMAGTLASEYGLTGWKEDAAMVAAGEGLRLWRSMRGRGSDETIKILQQVSEFIDKHGDSRFSEVEKEDQHQVRDRAGWWRDSENGREFLFTGGGMREALHGFDFSRSMDVLQSRGVVPPSKHEGERRVSVRISKHRKNLYSVHESRLDDEISSALT